MFTYILLLALLFHNGYSTHKKTKKLDRLIIACRTTDFECFKRQYQFLRDKVLMGNECLHIPIYQNFVFEYGPHTCIKIWGLDESELKSIGIKHKAKKFVMTLSFPLRIQQVKKNGRVRCISLDFGNLKILPFKGTLRRFSGNATIEISYPYKLKVKHRDVYMKLADEDLDVILDIPDLSHFDRKNKLESQLFEWSEWAFDVINHIDAAQTIALPYTSQLKKVFDHLPMRRFFLLYPNEQYMNLSFYRNCTMTV